MIYNEVIIAMGGNIGNVTQTFQKAILLLNQNGFIVEKKASNHITPAENCEPGANDFTNSALYGLWSDSPEKLLKLCQKIEVLCGRPENHPPDISRTLDLDIITFGSLVLKKTELVIPHPEAVNRFFVLKPIYEIKPDLTIPKINATVGELIDRLLNQKIDCGTIVVEEEGEKV